MSWRFARTPKWVVRHVLVAVLVVVMIQAGFWQMRRHDDKQAFKALVEERQEQPAVPVEDLLPVDAPVDGEAVEAAEQRRVTAVGTYRHEDSVVVENRTFNGTSGGWVLTPLVLEDGSAVLVLRGFIGFDPEGRIAAPPPPAGAVAVEGLLQPSQERGRIGATDPEGRQDVLVRADVERFAEQVDYPVRPAYLQLESSDPPEPDPAEGQPVLVALGAPTPDVGPHLSYAVQWVIFTTIAAVGYVLLLRKVAIDQAKAARAAARAAARVEARAGADPPVPA